MAEGGGILKRPPKAPPWGRGLVNPLNIKVKIVFRPLKSEQAGVRMENREERERDLTPALLKKRGRKAKMINVFKYLVAPFWAGAF